MLPMFRRRTPQWYKEMHRDVLKSATNVSNNGNLSTVNDARAENDERQTAREQIELVQQQKREKVEVKEENGKLDNDEASRTPKSERIADELPKSGSVSSLLSAWKNRSSDQSPSTPVVRSNFTRQEKKKSTPVVVAENSIQNSEPEIKEEKNNHEEVDSSSYIRSSVSNTDKDELKNIPLPSARSLRSLFEKGGETKPVEKKVSVTRRFSFEKQKEPIVTSKDDAIDEDQTKSNGTTHQPDVVDSKDGTPSRLSPDEEKPVKGSIKSLLAKFNR
ncbi:DgyrCDS3901 [Dimorphilus gyrociliatus]|uniref:DgyrCDS3901 n=1 Tax=Dimorphilus gyrociliatus TaxID=2664684 RepID=A0A7I8VF98_9ANNE|nr:DgyrCDS3901 [Dimorphilus gyrociliatus]